MIEQGIIVGCDKNQEWLLPWWWENYRLRNDYPVAFFDFGLSEKAKEFCRSKGLFLQIPEELLLEDDSLKIDEQESKKWEESFTKEKLWSSRQSWLKKCSAAYLSPFSKTIWIDMDCQVNQNLESLFSFLENHDIAMVKEDTSINLINHVIGTTFLDEPLYNTGVIAFRTQSSIISKWLAFTKEQSHAFSGDENILSRLIYNENFPVFELPFIYNVQGLYPKLYPVITHFAGPKGKEYLKKLVLYPYDAPFSQDGNLFSLNKGIIIGLDKNCEWLLSWWWENYKKHNNLPVAIFDFGMTEAGLEIAKKIGPILELPPELVLKEAIHEISEENKEKWEKIFNKENLWQSRPSWLKKPCAAYLSPFEKTIWIDVDCQVHDNLEPMFNYIDEHPIALVRESIESNFFDHILGCSYLDEAIYNSGVIVFHAKSDVIRKWLDKTYTLSTGFSGDQHILSRVIYEEKIPVYEMEEIYNFQSLAKKKRTVINHYSSPKGKDYLKKVIKNLKSDEQKMLT